MVLTPSTMLPLGTRLPSFALPDYNGRVVSTEDFRAAPALLVAFICGHCPFVAHIRTGFADFAREYQARGLAIIAVNSNDIEAFPEEQVGTVEQMLGGADFTELLSDILDEWSGEDVDELFELLETQLGDHGIDLKYYSSDDDEEEDEDDEDDDDDEEEEEEYQEDLDEYDEPGFEDDL